MFAEIETLLETIRTGMDYRFSYANRRDREAVDEDYPAVPFTRGLTPADAEGDRGVTSPVAAAA